MTSAAKSKTTKTKAAAKRANQSVPFEEMCRLMRVYGPTKCLRNRESPCGKGNMKVTSVKRKFYRWFPDLEERFVRDAAGFYRPKFGHEFEMRYREELRAKDSAILSRKRNDCRKHRYGTGKVKRVANPNPREAKASAIASRTGIAPAPDRALVSPVSFRDIRDVGVKPETDNDRSVTITIGGPNNSIAPASDCAPVSPVSFQDIRDIDLTLVTDNGASIVSDTGPLDGSFVAEDGIFDDVERSFFGPEDAEVHNLPSLPLVSSSSCGAVDKGPPQEDDSHSLDHDIDDMLGGPMKELCETILLLHGCDCSGPVFHFDAP